VTWTYHFDPKESRNVAYLVRKSAILGVKLLSRSVWDKKWNYGTSCQ